MIKKRHIYHAIPTREIDAEDVTSTKHRFTSSKMGVGTCRKFGLILWKNWLFRKRHYIMTCMEIILPTLFSALLLYIRNKGGTEYAVTNVKNFTEYPPIPVLHPVKTNGSLLLYAPDSNLSLSLLHYLVNTTFFNVKVKAVDNDEEMDEMARDDEDIFIGISFLGLTNNLTTKLHYRIRSPSDVGLWYTDLLTEPQHSPGPLKTLPPYSLEFLVIQHLIAVRYTELVTGRENLLTSNVVSMQKYPYPPYSKDSGFSELLRNILPLFIALSYIFISPTLIKLVVHEKELGVKELMKLMGLPGWLQWLGWFVSAFIIMTISAIIIVIILSCDWFGIMTVLDKTKPELFLFILILYVMSAICFCFFITTFLSKPTLATACGVLIWLMSYFIPFYVLDRRYTQLHISTKLLALLFPNMAMAWSIRFMLSFEGRGLGLGWSNLLDPSYPGDNLSLFIIIIMLIFDILFYAFLTWYLDNVLPSQFGVAKPWYFIFTKQYWCQTLPSHASTALPSRKNSRDFENDPVGLRTTVEIKGLTKRYGWFGKGPLAVKNLDLNMYEGQITALLGHNGAGKTTTMSMLTGMFPPTSGMAYINGYDIRTEIDIARHEMGLCPQHNMLFGNLTVKEHLQFFGSLKITNNTVLNAEVNNLMMKLQISDKQNTFTNKLSGGMKRKVNLGIALIGGPNVIMLDEPTSGMDPEARRAIWDLLQEYRTGRCIVLTTHFMEEADVLAERIAIMAKGRVVCCGSPLFLKNRFGAGYHLNISKGTECDVPKITAIIKQQIKGSSLDSESSTEVSYILPTDETKNFPALFRNLETDKSKLGVISFGISVTTMEEVFIKVGDLFELDESTENGSLEMQTNNSHLGCESREDLTAIETSPVVVRTSAFKANTGLVLWMEQFWGMILKRWYYARRRWILLIAQILIPVLTVYIVLSLNNVIAKIPLQDPPLVMDISQYGNTISFVDDITMENWYGRSLPASSKVVIVKDPEAFIKSVSVDDFEAYSKQYITGLQFENTSTDWSWLLNNTDLTRFNAFDFVKRNDSILNPQTWYNKEGNKSIPDTKLWYNGLYYHTQPLTLNLYHNTIVKRLTNDSDYSLTVENAPLPSTRQETKDYDKALAIFRSIMIGIFIPIGVSFLSSSFVVFPIHERATRCKHLQLMTGVGGTLFWGASFVWDFLTHIVCSCIILVIFITVDDSQTFSGSGKSEILFLVLVLFGWSSIPFTYLASFLTRLPATGFTRLTLINLIAGMILSIGVFLIKSTDPGDWINVVEWFCRVLPNFIVTTALMKMVQIASIKAMCEQYKICPKDISFLQWDSPGLGQDIVTLIFIGAAYFILLALLERGVFYGCWYFIRGLFRRCRKIYPEGGEEQFIGGLDRDVVVEKNRVRRILANNLQDKEVLLVDDLRKTFGGFTAVDGLSFAVGKAECFGLLGINGAGKTTTFEMLTGNLVVTDGNAYVVGTNLRTNRPEYLSKIGYCPQFDALLDHLSGREMLTVFAHLRGLPKSEISRIVDSFILGFDLSEHASKVTHVYSGGNKRKLSAAISFMGDPPVVFLDEPTTGVDPVARRKIWDILTNANSKGMSVILTSHSMEECEELCSRVAIMVNGQFQCFGGIQYLKDKFSQGFTILAKMKRLKEDEETMNNRQTKLQEYIEMMLPSASITDVHQGLIHYQVNDVSTKWTYLFDTMEKAKAQFDLEDYSVSQATLEQVFLSFARKQDVEHNPDKKRS